jgi:histidinol-phosphate aminotransferase
MEHALKQLHLYPDGNAFYLKNKLAEKLGLVPSNLILGNGSNEIIEFLGHALMHDGVDVVVSQYCFAVYPIVTRLFGANLISVPAQGFGHDIRAMLKAITPQTRVVFVANPNNPTGTLAAREDIVSLINDVPPNVLLVMDEAYIEFLNDPVDLLPFVRRGKPNLLLMRTFSKIHGLAGLRLGYGMGSPDLIAALEKVRQPFNINALVQAAALAALDDAEHIARTRANNAIGLYFFQSAFYKMKLPFVPSGANFVLVKVGEGQRVFSQLQRAGVITRPMAGYQLPEWLRISIGTPEENQRCLQALNEALGTSASLAN